MIVIASYFKKPMSNFLLFFDKIMDLLKFLKGVFEKKDDRKKEEIEVIKKVLDSKFSGNNNRFGDELSGRGFISGGLNLFTKIQIVDQEKSSTEQTINLQNQADLPTNIKVVNEKYQELANSIERADLKQLSLSKNKFKINFELALNAKNLGLIIEAKKRYELCYLLQPDNYRLISRYSLVLMDLEEFESALKVLIKFLKSKTKKTIRQIFDCNFLIAKVYDKQGRYSLARKAYIKSLNILKKSRKKILNHDTKVANVYCALGHVALVYSELNHGLDLFNKAALENHLDISTYHNTDQLLVGKILNCHAVANVLSGNYKVALDHSLAYKKVVNNLEKVIFVDPYDKVLSLLNLATVYFYNQEYKLSLELAEQAKDYIYENFGESFSLLVNVFGILSISYLLLDQDVRSEKYFARSVNMQSQTQSIASLLRLASIYSHRGNAFKLKKRFNQARQNYAKALKILENIFDPENLTLLKLRLSVADTQSSPLVIVTY